MTKIRSLLIGLSCISLQISFADDSYITEFAQKKLNKIDKNNNGSFEKNEDEKEWAKLKRYDKDKNDVISLEELKLQKLSYLKTAFKKNLNVVYKETALGKLYLDIYHPAETGKKAPVIFYTHGGGWAVGSKHGVAKGSFRQVFEELVKQGFCVVSVNYRLYTKGGDVGIRDCVADCKDAVRYVVKNSESLNVDSQRCYTMGDSAGGQLSQMLLLSSPEVLPGDDLLKNETYKMIAGVSWYGPSDFEDSSLFNHDDRKNFKDRFGPRILKPSDKAEDKLALYRQVSPINYLVKDSPPLFLIQGDKDTTIPVKHAYHMDKKAKELSAPVETIIVKNSGHNWRSIGGEITPTRAQIVEKTVKFLVDHL